MAKDCHTHSPSKRFSQGAKYSLIAILCALTIACSERSIDTHLEQAQVFIEQGNQDAAIIELKNAIQLDPSLSLPRYELGKVYIAQNKFEFAEKELSKALELGHEASQVIPYLTQAYQRTGANVALADLEFDEKSLTTVERLEVNFRKLQSYLELSKNAEARRLIDDMSSLKSNSVYKDLIDAHRHILDRDNDKALEKALAMRARAPLNRDVLNFTARLFRLNGEDKKAAEVYEEYVALASDDLEAKFLLSNLLVEQGEMEKAERYIDELMRISDENSLLNQLKGIVRAANEDYENGLFYSEKAIFSGRKDPKLRLIAGFSAYRLGEFEKAIEHLNMVVDLLPDGHPALRFLAISQLQSKRGIEASEILPRLGDIDAEDASLFSRAGYELLKSGETQAAKALIEQGAALAEDTDDFTQLGLLRLGLNDLDGLLDLEKALEQSPESAETKATLGAAYLASNQLQKALNFAKEWQASASQDERAYLLEAEVLQKQNKYAEALSIIEKLETFAADSHAVMIAKIRLLMRQNELQKAMVVTQKVLENTPSDLIALASYFSILYQQGEGQEALARIQGAFEQNTENTALALLLARAALLTSQPQLSLEALSHIEADRQAPLDFWPLKGRALRQAGQLDASEKHYQRWAEIAPMQQGAIVGQLAILNTKRDYDNAIALANNFLEKKSSTQVALLQAHFNALKGNAVEAKNTLASIDDTYKDIPFTRGVMARIALLEGRGEDAVADAIVAYEENPRSENLFMLVQALQISGQINAANQRIVDHTKAFPNDLSVKLLLADRLIASDTDAAIATYKEMLLVSPNNYVVLNNLAYVLLQQEQVVEALDYAEQAYTIEPNNIGVADTYAQVLIKEGELDKAIEVYSKAINKDVSNEDIILNYIEALLMNGSKAVAQRRLEAFEFRSPISEVRIEEFVRVYDL